MPTTLVWFRHDLRIVDHEPLHRAAKRGMVIPIYIFERALLDHPEACSAQIAFILECLKALDHDLRKLKGRLILRCGSPVEILPTLVKQTNADGMYAYTDCDRIYSRVRDARVSQIFAQEGLGIRWFEPPASIAGLIQYSKYRHRWYEDMQSPAPQAPVQVKVPEQVISEPMPSLEELGHFPDGKPIPKGGTAPARALLEGFFAENVESYYWQLSYPSALVTTGLSPYIKVGAISIRECVQFALPFTHSPDRRVQLSSKQLVSRLRWGSGFHQRFRYLPQLEVRSLYEVFDTEGWEFNAEHYGQWQEGKTGFPIIDASARCLLATGGWKELNFRSRANYSSFLSNLLGIDWRYGALHFMRHLLDGDCAIDHYQWSMQAGITHCVDKSWTRIYNPGERAIARYDPEGKFIKKWVPELKNVPVEELGGDLTKFGYLPRMLDYTSARRNRVKQLEAQRSIFRTQENIVPFLSRIPEYPIPFGSSSAEWILEANPPLLPPPLDLDSLVEPEKAFDLRTWLVAHVEIQPHKYTPSKSMEKSKSNQESAQNVQLSLFDKLF